MKTWKQLLIGLAVVLGGVSVALPASDALAINVFRECSGSNKDTKVCQATDDSAINMTETVINTLLLVLGMIAVIMIIIGGIRYTTSNGDAANITSAKNTILYSVVGLIVAILSYAIVNFVLSRF